jgi:predicted NACHT family NTPase/DNA-binding Xre family transcriptional regulator
MAAQKQSTQKTLQLSIEGGHKADKAVLVHDSGGNKSALAGTLAMSRTTLTNFFERRPVEQSKFKKICRELKLKWEEVIESQDSPIEKIDDIDAIVQQVRSAIEPLIREQCGTMRVLDMDQPIELTGDRGIYTNVNILEKQSRLRSERELLEVCDFDNRMVRERRIPGLEAVEKHRRLMVLGKPGAGKTTFLKYLAMQCITGGFAADQVPFFVTLKDFAEADDRPSLVDYLSRSIAGAKHLGHPTNVPFLLFATRALVLLDGLDEVREEDTARVIREMRNIADRCDSPFVITCRIAAKEYTFERFTEVEVADFGEQQIATFAKNWFRARDDLSKAEIFVQRLEQNRPIQELATNPLLLTLLCLVFGEGGEFPSNRADLYEEGVRILLKKWDAKRGIQRNDLYKKLDVQRREDLLSYLALLTFQQKEYFIKQRRLETYIADFISNLRDVDPEPEALQIDSAVVLQSIQARHGLLVERARGIYSFSHLTFQEYFTAREISATNQVDFLVDRIGEKRWREVFLLTVRMMRNADRLLLAMKSHIDFKLGNNERLKLFLQSIHAVSLSGKINCKHSVIRARYCAFARDNDNDYYDKCTRTLDRIFSIASTLERDCDHVLDMSSDLDLARALARARNLNSVFSFVPTGNRAIYELANALGHVPLNEIALTNSGDIELRSRLQDLRDRLPSNSWPNRHHFVSWWRTESQQWIKDLYQLVLRSRNIGHDWQFTDAQKALLQQYYDANLLLIECLNSDCYVSRSVREEIEATLLLPVSELRMQN